MSSETLSDLLKRKRAEFGLTQKEMAEKMDVAKRTYEDWEYGNRHPLRFAKEHILKTLVKLDLKYGKK